MTSDWHIPDDLRDRYLAGTLDAARAMSVDAHLGRCADCRGAVPYEPDWLEASWRRLESEVVGPSLRPAERLLRLAGVPGHLARLLAATPAASRAWVAAVTLALAFAVLAAREAAAYLPAFLVLAPVLPLTGIALAYGPRVDPAHELMAATPLAGPRLLLTRATAVLAVAVVLAGLASPLLPAPPGLSAAWLLPALAAAGGCLALVGRLPGPIAALAMGGSWLAIVGLGRLAAGSWLAAFGPLPQVLYGVAALLMSYRVYRMSLT
ncbi:zf-HC2 domain-containing protein [Actinomadura sp. ATCC 31491]|uniref:Zf-HC2 domain-containing protein n=1 Tax=Actinomadura luzonensis TaxID=2805427 RepID=A0ABT0FMG9_9ACTN|nr:zf-HC2 domain-containing protein [Actinomadura luzonensis]MCK2213434.1 zf-HC2 domain-containing protein [Actinomadura luzonensis]